MIHISSNVVLPLVTGFTDSNHPLVGYHSVVTPSNVSGPVATLSTNPARLVASPETYSYWSSSTNAQQALTIDVSGAFDYVGIARHNFATVGRSVWVEGFDGSTWSQISDPFLPPRDDPIMIVFPREERQGYRVVMSSGSGRPRVSVLYLGNLLALPSRIYVGHAPIPYAIKETMTDGMSDAGEYLGRVYTNEHRIGSISQQNIDPILYREKLDPWVRFRDPFFFAWRPQSYPQEVGYVWRVGDAHPSNQRPNGMMQLTMNVLGVR